MDDRLVGDSAESPDEDDDEWAQDGTWEDVADQLMRLWDVRQLDADELDRLAPLVVNKFGFGDPDVALVNLTKLLHRFVGDPHIGALAAALGLHPQIGRSEVVDPRRRPVALGVSDRLQKFGYLNYLSERTVRRDAEKGAHFLAEDALSVSQRSGNPQVTVNLRRRGDAIQVEVYAHESDNAAPVSVAIMHGDFYEVISTFEARRVTCELTLELGVLLSLSWLCPVPPEVDVDVNDVPLRFVSYMSFGSTFGLLVHASEDTFSFDEDEDEEVDGL